MDNLIYAELAMLVFSTAGFVYGAGKYLKPRKPLYASMIVLGVGCIMLGRAYSVLRLITGLQVAGVFSLGILGTVGAFLFFFSSNFGQIDSLVDGGGKEFVKYRVIAITGVLITAALYVFILLSPAEIWEKVTDGCAALIIASASYFHVKHILIPDIDYGVVRCQRMFNVMALCYGILSMLEFIAFAYMNETMLLIVSAFECLISGLIVPVMDRGVRRWSR